MRHELIPGSYKDTSNVILELVAAKDQIHRELLNATEMLACYCAKALASYLVNDLNIDNGDTGQIKVVVPILKEGSNEFTTAQVIGIYYIEYEYGKYLFNCKYKYLSSTNVYKTDYGTLDPHMFTFLPKFGNTLDHPMFTIIKNLLNYF